MATTFFNMPLNYNYTTSRLTAHIDAATFISHYRRPEEFLGYCRQCHNYGRRYGCPPFDYDPLTILERYSQALIVGAKIVPADAHLPIGEVHTLLRPIMTDMNKRLLEQERQLGGLAFGFTGMCPYCGDEPCARISGQPCRHPDWVRPSLEAYGFDPKYEEYLRSLDEEGFALYLAEEQKKYDDMKQKAMEKALERARDLGAPV